MAYMNQERKRELAPAIKKVLKEYGVKASLSVNNYSTLVCNIKSSKIDFLERTDRDHMQVNNYYIDSHFKGKAREFLTKLNNAMNAGNHDKSDLMTDYFDVGWYVDINIGKWNKPYICEKG